MTTLFGCHSPAPPPSAAADYIRWEYRGPARFSIAAPDATSNAGSPRAPAPEQLEDINRMSVEELARHLRPIMLFKGKEYQASWEDALTLAELAISARNAPGPKTMGPPRAGGSSTELVQQKEIVPPNDTRAAIFGAGAAEVPFKYVGFMKRDIFFANAKAMCTCIKMVNHATCVTAAHCVHTGTGDEEEGVSPDEWKHPLPDITFMPTATSPMPTLRPDEEDENEYAIIIPEGWTRSRALDIAVLRFRGMAQPGAASGDLKPTVDPDENVPNPVVPPGFFDMGPLGFAVTHILGVESGNTGEQRIMGDFFVVGFPGPTPEFPTTTCGSMSPCLTVGHSTHVTYRKFSDFTKRFLFYPNDSSKGQSGGPVFIEAGNTPDSMGVVAIHKGTGRGDLTPLKPYSDANWGVRISDEIYQFLAAAAGGSATVFP